ncbi:hypothetical protein [Burkholderia sp. BCC0405]|uniref:hypothetical protein n=1 Tax=Burkholderia sp. BCC0405 TaxID=2676298 RepID=UPI001FC7F641|nr:hypothetical protein [Burkholderia sp. BCC0405]
MGSAIGVRKDDDTLCTSINQALASLIQDGGVPANLEEVFLVRYPQLTDTNG